ncbi:MAG: histidinol dehydrogenase, partial [Verrucomicrobiales bacterium]|nr:histidinol dehydrogenase [Verrucomicrobiales bacterium]
MREIWTKKAGFEKVLKKFSRRAVPPDDVRDVVAEISGEVRKRGDRALIGYAAKFDGVKLTAKKLRVSIGEIAAAEAAVDAKTRRAVAASHKNVLAFAKKSLRKDWKMTNAQGAEVGEIFLPFDRVGVYVPGGTAPLVSTALMTVTLAQAAGVQEIVACSPCGADGVVNRDLLYALKVAGATEIYKIGGAQAVAAMAYGTRTIGAVTKVFGPGNKFVVEAKRQSMGAVAIDLLPGPSEVLVLADSSGDPRCIAADILAQAEHGGESQVGFITDSEKLLEAVKAEVVEQAESLSRQDAVRAVLKKNTVLVLVDSMEEGADLVNAYAPEHLSLIAKREKSVMKMIRTAGAIFLGNQSPVAVGDFL